MTTVITQTLYRKRRAKGEVVLAPTPPPEPEWRPSQRELTIAQAWYFLHLLDTAVVEDQAQVAKLFGVTRARVSQILNFLDEYGARERSQRVAAQALKRTSRETSVSVHPTGVTSSTSASP